MELENSKLGEILTLKPKQRRIDASCSSEFKSKMLDWINTGNDCIVLDLTDVEFLDSSGLGAIVFGLKTLGDRGDFVICGAREAVMALFNLTRMNKVFEIFSSKEEAINTLTSRKGYTLGMENVRVIRFSIDSKMDNVVLAGLAAKGICSYTALSDAEACEVEVCVVEAINKIIEHAYGGAPGREIELVIYLPDDRITFQICDSGKSFDAKYIAKLKDHESSSDNDPMGLMIIKNVMDDIIYKTGNSKNILVMSKKFKKVQ